MSTSCQDPVSWSKDLDTKAGFARRQTNDLLALLDLPGAWRGGDPEAIVRSLVEVLARLLCADGVLVRIQEGEAVLEHHFPAGMKAGALLEVTGKAERTGPVLVELQRPDAPEPTTLRAIAVSPRGGTGSVVVASTRSSFPTEHEVRVLETAAAQAALAIQSGREALAHCRLAEERAHLQRLNAMLARAELLADASAFLVSPLDCAEALTRIAHLAVPRLGDWMVIRAEGRTITVHRDPARADEARQRTHSLVAGVGPVGVGRAAGMAFAPIATEGHVLGVLVLGNDQEGETLSDETLSLLEELGERCGVAVEAARRRREAREAERRRDEFLAILGHELRHPLCPITSALSLMKLKDPNVFERERRIMERQVQHLARLVDDLLEVSRITSGKIQLERQSIDLHGVVTQAVEMIGPLFERFDHDLVVVQSPEPLTVQGDTTRLAQVVANLLANAAKYTDPGGRIRVSLANVSGQAELRVSDSGVGIAPEVLPRVFDAFVQDQSSIDRAHGGLGLGLAIVRSLVEMHGGSVTAQSGGRGLGSEFVVRLPLAPSIRPEPPPERAAQPPS